MEVIALASVIFLLLAIYPFAVYPLFLRYSSPPSRTAGSVSPAAAPDAVVSLCVCAYNEEAVIRDKVRNMLELQAATTGKLELLVYVDGSSDRTADILREYADRLTLVVGEVRRGKSFGMNELVRRARGDIIVFSDANVMLESQAVNRLRARFADPEVGLVCGHLHYTNGEASPTAQVNSAYWRLEEFIKARESERGCVMGADGSLFAIRRHLHRQVPDDIIDDFFISMSILCDGHKVVNAPDALAWENTATSAWDEIRRKVRISCQSANVHRLLWPRISRLPASQLFMYLSHKVLRWLTGANLIISGVLALTALTMWGGVHALGIAVGLAILFLVAAALRIRPAPQLLEIVAAMVATSFGVVLSLFGARFKTWRPAASVRGPVAVTPPAFTNKAQLAPEDLSRRAG